MDVVAVCGSLRKESWNRKLLALLVERAQGEGASVEYLDYGDLPPYNQDVENRGMPPEAERVREAIRPAQALIIACPEYNNSIPGVLKNAIDWASRPPNALAGKVALAVGASPGRSGAVRAHMHLSYVLESLGVWVVPGPRILIPNVSAVIGADGRLLDEALAPLLDSSVRRLLAAAEALGT